MSKELGLDDFNHYDNWSDRDFWDKFVIPVVKQRDNFECQCCGSKENLHIHHASYSRDISIKDLVMLCCGCHRLCHSEKNINYYSEKKRVLVDKLIKNDWKVYPAKK